ncbi:MAG: hypothetical protein R2860_03125 [Desulfobacterales bacterium]
MTAKFKQAFAVVERHFSGLFDGVAQPAEYQDFKSRLQEIVRPGKSSARLPGSD